MIQKLLSENSITLVFGVVIRNESDSEDTARNVFLRNFIQVQMYGVCKGIYV